MPQFSAGMAQFHRFRSIRLDSVKTAVKTAADAESLDADCGELSKPYQKLSYARFRWNGAMPQFHRFQANPPGLDEDCGEDCGRRCFVANDSSLSIVLRKSELFQLQTNFMGAASK